MTAEVSLQEALPIHARAFLAGFSGLSGMLEDFLRAHDALKARGAESDGPPGYQPLLRTAHDVIELVFESCRRIAGPCRAALDPRTPADPRLSMAVNDSMTQLSDLLERLSRRIELPIGQWVTEIAAVGVEREDWPAMWRLSVWLGATLHHAEDAAVALQALMQFLTMGSVLPTRREGAEWLNEHGALAALDEYRRVPAHARKTLNGDVSQSCAYALLALAQAAKARAERATEVADAILGARFLDAKDLIHLGIHSQAARPGGVFLSHRGKDAKKALMDFHRAGRPEIFLDIWARPAGDTNRRFLWRNLAAAAEMHAFVTANYAASDFCMKEVEAWGLISLARGHTPADTPGRLFVIEGAATGPEDAPLCHWTRHCRHDTTLAAAMIASGAALGGCGVLDARAVHSAAEKDVSDAFNRALLGSSLLHGSDLLLIELSREPIEALFGVLRDGLSLLRREGDVSRAAIDALEEALPTTLPASGRAFVSTLREVLGRLRAAVQARPQPEAVPVLRCGLLAMAALCEMAAHVVRHWDGDDPEAARRSLFAFTKFGMLIDAVGEQFPAWCIALASAGFERQGDEELSAGLLLGLLPIDHEDTTPLVRIDAGFRIAPGPTLPQGFEAAGLARRTVQVVCTHSPTLWQRVAVIAALSSFTSRSYLFIDVERSGALAAHVGSLAMDEFPHVTLARIEDLPPA
jgi:hypothetical protein